MIHSYRELFGAILRITNSTELGTLSHQSTTKQSKSEQVHKQTLLNWTLESWKVLIKDSLPFAKMVSGVMQIARVI
ncbi:MAG: hypothetical protein QM401_07655 [Bacillota bacterium]|nr:hypothetical protein [Bacillota bacterium]